MGRGGVACSNMSFCDNHFVTTLINDAININN